MSYISLSIILCFVVNVLADLTCVNFVPKGFHNAHTAYIHFAADPKYYKPVPSSLPANASIGNPLALASTNATGSLVQMQSCNSTSLGISSSEQDSDCDDTGCFKYYTNYVRIKNPATGHCMTRKNPLAARTELVFETCNASPTDTSQIWVVQQDVNYYNNFSCIENWGTVIILPTTGDDGAWVLFSDSHTISVQSANTRNRLDVKFIGPLGMELGDPDCGDGG